MFEHSSLSPPVLFGILAALSAPAAASAQGSVATGTVLQSVAMGGNLPISDESARAMIEKNLSDVFVAGADKNHVILIVDATGQYVNGKSIKATVFQRVAAEDGKPMTAAVHDTTGSAAGVVVARVELSGTAIAGTAAPGSIVISRAEGGPGTLSAGAGMMGMGIAPSDIETVGTKSFPSGGWRDAALTVTVIKLK